MIEEEWGWVNIGTSFTNAPTTGRATELFVARFHEAEPPRGEPPGQLLGCTWMSLRRGWPGRLHRVVGRRKCSPSSHCRALRLLRRVLPAAGRTWQPQRSTVVAEGLQGLSRVRANNRVESRSLWRRIAFVITQPMHRSLRA